jgi:hypothetical protein
MSDRYPIGSTWELRNGNLVTVLAHGKKSSFGAIEPVVLCSDQRWRFAGNTNPGRLFPKLSGNTPHDLVVPHHPERGSW